MGATESRSKFKNLAVAAVNTVAASAVIFGSMWAIADVTSQVVPRNLGIGTTITCALIAAVAVGVACGLFLRVLFRRYGTVAASSGVLAIPLLYSPIWTLATSTIAAGAVLIWFIVRRINRRDDPRLVKPPAASQQTVLIK